MMAHTRTVHMLSAQAMGMYAVFTLVSLASLAWAAVQPMEAVTAGPASTVVPAPVANPSGDATAAVTLQWPLEPPWMVWPESASLAFELRR